MSDDDDWETEAEVDTNVKDHYKGLNIGAPKVDNPFTTKPAADAERRIEEE